MVEILAVDGSLDRMVALSSYRAGSGGAEAGRGCSSHRSRHKKMYVGAA